MKLLTQREVAEILRCSVQTVARLRASGGLPYIRGRPVKIREEDLKRYIAKSISRGTAVGNMKSDGQSETQKRDALAHAAYRRTRMTIISRKR